MNRANYFADLDEHPEHPPAARCPLCVPCTFCGAIADRKCMTKHGTYLSAHLRAHLPRVRAAYEQ